MKNIDLSKVLVGLFLIFLGVGFLLDRMFGISFDRVLEFAFPIFIILIGVTVILRSLSQWLWGLLLIGIGSFILVDEFIAISFSVWDLWPLILVLIGFRIVFSRGGEIHTPHSNSSTEEGDKFDSVAIFWGEEKKIKSSNLKSGKITTIFGGSDIDLRNATIASDGAIIDIVVMFGGVTIRVNPEVEVRSKGVGIIGAFEDHSSKSGEQKQILTITGTAMFGGVEVKN